MHIFHPREPLSALTHFIGLVLSVLGTPFLLICVAQRGAGPGIMLSYSVFALSMIGLYAASSAYHSFQLGSERGNRLLKKTDHIMICILIAGTYTPFCMDFLPRAKGIPMLIAVWGLAVAGTLFKAIWVNCPKWISSVIYICMGWTCVFAFPTIYRCLALPNFLWLLSGGISYTIGGVIYALKLPLLRRIHPELGAHELFHIFVMIGTFCQYVAMLV